ncbi:MAG: hypothetical protein FWG13_04890 [Leptospirales bacterium]|nr:hypothetical protein [Leptospirales bacterium]
MKNKGIFCLVLLFVLFSANALFAIERRDYFLKPQIGAWFGPVTPVGVTAESLEPNLGGGIFTRYNLPWRYLKIGADISYEFFEQERGVNKMHLVPIYGNFIFLFPFSMPIKIQAKLGAGSAYLHVQPADASRWDPIFVVGGEFSFPAGRFFNIGLRVDYIHIYEGHLKGSQVDGHIVNAGIALYFNLNIF